MSKNSNQDRINLDVSRSLSNLLRETTISNGLILNTDVAHDMVFIIDVDDQIAFVNDHGATQFNLPPQEIVGKKRDKLFSPKVVEKQTQSIRKVLEKGEPIYEKTVTGFPGAEKLLGTKLIPLRNKKGEISHILGISRDLTDLKKTEEVIKRDEKLLQTLINNSPVVIFAIDSKGIFTHSDGKGLESLGLKPGEAVGNSVYEMFKDYAGIIENFEYALKGNSVSFVSKVDEATFEISYSPTYDAEGNVNGITGIGIDVTEKKESEETIQLLNTALEAAANGIAITDIDGNFIWVNDSFTKLTGYSFSEVKGANPRLLKSDHHDQDFYKNLWKTITSGKVWSGEIINKRKDGSIYYEEQTITPVRNYLGEITHFIAIKQDITNRKKTEQLIRESEEKYRSLFDRSKDGILLHDLDGHIIDGNVQVLELMGYDKDELLKMNTSNLYQEGRENDTRKKLLENGFVNFEIEFIRKDKAKFHADVVSSLVEIGGEKLVQAIVRDITKRKKTEAQLLESEERLRSFYENSSIGVYRSTPDGSIKMANPALKRMLGIENIEQHNLNDLSENIYVNNNDRLRFQKILERDGKVTGFETAYSHPNGKTIYTREYARVVKDEKGNVLYYEGTLEDITEKKEAEKAIIEAKNQAEKSDQLKTFFLAQMSHEIRTPVNAILSFSNLIKDEVQENISNELKDSFQIIQSEGLRITRTIELILNMSEIQTGTYEVQPAEFDVLEDVLDSIRKEYTVFSKQKNLKIIIDKKTNNTLINADSYSVYQIFANLIDNAIKYTYVGGITIMISRNKSNKLVVSVSDTGIGISKEYIPMLFKPFSQEDIGYTRKFEGNGLGLALVKNYCDMNNADIEVKSEKGKGTTFTVTFPN